MTRSHAIFLINSPIIELIVHFWAAGRRTLPQILHCQSLHDDYNGTRLTSGPCRLHKSCCNRVDSNPINPIIAYYCDYLNYYCDYSETQNSHLVGYLMCKTAQDQKAITHHLLPQPILHVQAQDHAEQRLQNRSSWCKSAIPFAWPDGTDHQDCQPFKQLQHVCPPKCDQDQSVPSNTTPIITIIAIM